MQESDKDFALNDAERQQVTEALDAILATDKFDAAPQMSAFLRYVVEQAADGNQNRIKAFTVAVDALGKPETFDPQNDPVVRVLAGRLRASLSAYNDENPSAPLRITMTPGSYVPTFLAHESDAGNDQTANQAPEQHASDADNVVESSANAGTEPISSVVPDSIGPIISSPSDPQADAGSDVSKATIDNHANPTIKHNANFTEATPGELLGKLTRVLTQRPKLALACVLLASVGVAVVKNGIYLPNEPDMHAATATGSGGPLVRPRPDEPSVFISAVDEGSSLENSLNAVISGAISEDELIKVYRILDKERETRFWPEDYILTLTALDLPEEIRVNMQLMDATTGRIIHSDVVSLNELAFEQLTQQELSKLITTARSIVSEGGPLLKDYASKQLER